MYFCLFLVFRDDCSGLNTLKRRPPSPPKRQQSCEDNSKCHQVTVVADMHCVPTMQPKYLGKWTVDHNMSSKHNLEDHVGSNASFKVNLFSSKTLCSITICHLVIYLNVELKYFKLCFIVKFKYWIWFHSVCQRKCWYH